MGFVGLVLEFVDCVELVPGVVDSVGLVPVSILATFFCRYFLLGVRLESSSMIGIFFCLLGF